MVVETDAADPLDGVEGNLVVGVAIAPLDRQPDGSNLLLILQGPGLCSGKTADFQLVEQKVDPGAPGDGDPERRTELVDRPEFADEDSPWFTPQPVEPNLLEVDVTEG